VNAEIIAVGSELLTPFRLDTNSLFLTDELNRLGVAVIRKSVIGDDREELRSAFREALARADLVVSSGGLGPTEDDLTREAVAELLGRRLVRNERILERIRARFRSFGREMAPINERQALVPEGAIPLENANGTAPGLWLEADGHIVVLLPGPPAELQPMFSAHVRPMLAERAGRRRISDRVLRIAGMPESEVDQRAAPIYRTYRDVETTILAAPGEIELHFRVWSEDSAAAGQLLDEVAAQVAAALGDSVFTSRDESLEEVVARELLLRGATIAVAESCTGGLLSQRFTSIPGSSNYFLGGVVSYSNELKTAMADVPAALIEAHGAVSAEVALAMADGIRRRVRAALGLSVTGIAGPGGGSAEKPVGTVHIGLADEREAKQRKFLFPGDRERVRRQAAQAALDMVRRYFLHARGEKG
jgi:competence/damage-inducible protein CinA-like protein